MPTYGIDDRARAVAQQRVLLGDQPEPGRDDRSRLVLEGRPAGWAASTGTCSGRGRRAARSCRCSTSTDDVLARRRHTSRVAGQPELLDSRRSVAAAAREPPRARANAELLLEHRDAAALPAGRLPRDQQIAGVEPAGISAAAGASIPLSATADRNDYFFDATTFRRPERCRGSRSRAASGRLAGAPLYFGVNSEYVTLARSITKDNVKTSDTGPDAVGRQPVLRVPFTRWPFLTVNSSVSWRGTYWTESLATDRNVAGARVGIGRQYLRFAGADHGARVQPDLEHAEQRVRREVQARHRADADDLSA